MRFINLTPRAIDIYRLDGNGILVSVPSSGKVAQLAEDDSGAGQIWADDFSVVRNWEDNENYKLAVPYVQRDWGHVDKLPTPEDGTL